jgi:hypothetical protein
MAKKDIETDVPKATDAPTSNVRSYFTKDINDQILGMGVKEMESLMKDLASTRHWIALLKYTSMRTPLLDATLRGTDPSKEPGKISWAQGAMAGLCDIEGYVIDLNTPAPKTEQTPDDEIPETRTEGTIVG